VLVDLLRSGTSWLADTLNASAGYSVTYRRGNSSTAVLATIGKSVFEAGSQSGVVETWESRDYLLRTEDLPFGQPLRGDLILESTAGIVSTYEVSTPRGVPLFRYADAFRAMVRVHTTMAQNSGTLLARAVGASASAAASDAEILALTVTLGSTSTLSQSVAASSAYVYLALPTAFGTPTIKINGIVSSAWSISTRSITFTNQSANSYTIYRSIYAITGTALVEVI
jgi:hypothetical protein